MRFDLEAGAEVLEGIELAERIDAAIEAARAVPIEKAREAETKANLLAALIEAERGEASLARQHRIICLIAARRVAEALGEGARGRPESGKGVQTPIDGPEIPALDLSKDQRKRYRLMLEVSPERFRSYLDELGDLSRTGLARIGADLRRQRKAEEAEAKAAAVHEAAQAARDWTDPAPKPGPGPQVPPAPRAWAEEAAQAAQDRANPSAPPPEPAWLADLEALVELLKEDPTEVAYQAGRLVLRALASSRAYVGSPCQRADLAAARA